MHSVAVLICVSAYIRDFVGARGDSNIRKTCCRGGALYNGCSSTVICLVAKRPNIVVNNKIIAVITDYILVIYAPVVVLCGVKAQGSIAISWSKIISIRITERCSILRIDAGIGYKIRRRCRRVAAEEIIIQVEHILCLCPHPPRSPSKERGAAHSGGRKRGHGSGHTIWTWDGARMLRHYTNIRSSALVHRLPRPRTYVHRSTNLCSSYHSLCNVYCIYYSYRVI